MGNLHHERHRPRQCRWINRRPVVDTSSPCGCGGTAARHPAVAQSARRRRAVALVGIGGALIYALQTRDPGKSADELYSTDNRTTADGLAGLPRDYTGPVLGPALPGDLGRPILSAQNQGQPVAARHGGAGA
jgi:type IV secretion system protein VirB10